MTVYDIATRLPSIEQLRQRCKALAVLELIVDGSWSYYAYTSGWGEDEAALMSNGSGDEWAVVFTTEGAFIRVFDHESRMSPFRDQDRELWPGLLDGLPAAFRRQVEEPAFGDIEFPAPRGPHDDTGPDGAGMLEILLDDIVNRYVEFAEDYYEITVNRTTVEHVVAHRPLTDTVVQALNPELTVAGLREDLAAIGYPITAE